MIASVAPSWWARNITDAGKLPLLIGFAAFVVTFLATRLVTRLIRAGRGPFSDNVSASGLHVHHSAPGIIALVIGAFTAVASASDSAWRIVAAVLVGVGTSLVLDEFALILHLEDVYWAQEGRLSVEMISLAFGCLGFTLVGFSPLGVDDMGSAEVAVRIGAMSSALVTLGLVVVCVFKGKSKMALFGVFVPLLAWVGAARLARPHSVWAKRWYGEQRRMRAAERTAAFDARWDPVLDHLSDLIAGKPSEPDPNA
ncbi:MAG: hypothetical protein ABIR32_20795 [Ilumatobacteraceae bacterium]